MIKITDTYYLNADSNCYILCIKQDKLDKDGNVIYTNDGYYSTIEQALNGLIKREVRKFISKDDAKSIEDLKTEIIRLREYVESLNLKI